MEKPQNTPESKLKKDEAREVQATDKSSDVKNSAGETKKKEEGKSSNKEVTKMEQEETKDEKVKNDANMLHCSVCDFSLPKAYLSNAHVEGSPNYRTYARNK